MRFESVSGAVVVFVAISFLQNFRFYRYGAGGLLHISQDRKLRHYCEVQSNREQPVVGGAGGQILKCD